MLGLSPYVTRSELLHRKATGIAKEYGDWFQANVLDYGHEVEALARPIVEDYLGEELYPVSAKEGRLWVSTDGMNMTETVVWENKQWSAPLAESIAAGVLPEHHQPQCQQSLMITGADRLLFTVSDGTRENTLFLWVKPDAEWFKRLRDGWAQFEKDLATYVPPPPAAPKLTGRTMDALPALRVMVEGKITDSNLTAWVEGARGIIASINRSLKTDQDFADAEAAVKGCEKAENWLATAKQHALSQTADIAAFFATVDSVAEEFRQVRLELDKLVTRRKTEVKTEIVSEHAAMLHSHIVELNAGLAPFKLPMISADFGAAMKGKRSVQTATDAAGVELARAKIEATNKAQAMARNLRLIDANPDFSFLLNDAATLILKDSEAVEAIIAGRIAQHKTAEQAKRDAETARIRAEEQAKAEATARAHAAEILRQEREAQEARAREAAAETKRADDVAAAERRNQDEAARTEREQAESDPHKLGQVGAPVSSAVAESIVSSSLEAFEGVSRADTVRHFNRIVDRIQDTVVSESQPEHAWINLGKMAEAFGFRLDAEFVTETLGVPFSRTEKTAKFWTPTQFEAIKRKLAAHVLGATPIPF